jgi:hypothetical protein
MQQHIFGTDSDILYHIKSTSLPRGWSMVHDETIFGLGVFACFLIFVFRIVMLAREDTADNARIFQALVSAVCGIGFAWYGSWATCALFVCYGMWSFSFTRAHFRGVSHRHDQAAFMLIFLLLLWCLVHFLGGVVEAYSSHYHMLRHVDSIRRGIGR